MSFVTAILLCALCLVVVTGLVAAALDLSKIASRSLDRTRARRACRRGWDWPAFEREVARYTGGRGGRRHATPPPR